ncbi:hypothetical protein MJN51_32220 [Salmonella enterica subsp. enterica serovar Kentucky]|nr:hypothetical protein [Salmonella enterica subsp. enterica serovar Kentucky]
MGSKGGGIFGAIITAGAKPDGCVVVMVFSVPLKNSAILTIDSV